MSYCLPRPAANAFLQALKTGGINPDQLMGMTSQQRREHFAQIVGDNNAREVNSLFESKLLLVDQKRGLVTWAKQMGGLSDRQKLDFIGKVQKLEQVLEPAEERAFLEDLAAQKIGATVTPAEAKTISQGAKKIVELQAAWDPTTQTWPSEDRRLEYGAAKAVYQDYIGALLRDANAKNFKEWITQPKLGAILDIANATKGIVASLDNSFFGRQGLKVLYTKPGIWTNGFVKSWGDIGKTLIGGDPMLALKADILSRPNALNGKYANGKFALGQDVEEAFPTSIPERIPLFGRLYKASENAFVGGALRLRADMADRVIKAAEEAGVDMSHPNEQAAAIGDLVNSMTGRGNIGRASGEWVNAALFSIRFLKANYDTLTMHSLGFGIEKGPARDFVRKQSAENLAKIVGGMAATLFAASQLWPGSVEWDPRSSNFGKIRIGNTRFDISGGMSSLVVLAARLVPTQHNGRRSFWSKSAGSGKWTDLTAGKYGQQSALDVIENFWEGKLSPAAGLVRDVWKGETFGGEPVTLEGAIESLTTPISYQSFKDALNDPNPAPLLAVVILDGLGIGASTYSNHHPKNPKGLLDLLGGDGGETGKVEP